MRREFVFNLHYYDLDGKLIKSVDYPYKCVCRLGASPYMPSIIEHIRGLAIDDGSTLPGLTARWRGPIIIQYERRPPYLILPKAEWFDEVI